MQTRIPPLFRSVVFWLLIAVFALEFFLFDHFGARRHTPLYPRWNDQIQYLTESYTGYEYARSRGYVAGLLNALTNPSAQGTLHDFFAIIAFMLAGPSRSAALSLNMLALIAWQVAMFFAVARASGSRPLAFASAMLPLALSGPWLNGPGSAYDFRLDHFAMCAIGATAATAILADGFHSRSGTTWFGVAVGLAILTRFLTGTYFVVIFIGLAGWIMLGPPERKPRGLNLLRAGVIAGVIAAPILWMNFDAVRDYYWIGHYIGPESAIRNPNMGVGRSLRFVLEHLGRRHVGLFFAALTVGGIFMLALNRRTARQPANNDLWTVGAIFLLAPLLVLTLHPQKSEVVISALVPGLVMLAIAAWSTSSQHASATARSIFAGVVTTLVLGFFVHTQVPPAYTPATYAELRQVNIMADRIFARARAGGLKEPRVGVDYITDCLDAQVLRVICYERHRVVLPMHMTLPTSIAEPDESVVMARLAESDFVFVTENAPPGGYPYDKKLAEMSPSVRAWCDANLRAAETFTLLGRRMVLYQRPELPLP